MNKEEFYLEMNKLEINVTKEIIFQLELYMEELLNYNSHTNLTAIRTREEAYLKHFYDSLTLTRIIDLTKVDSLLDIGTGAGFPGLVLAIIFPNIHVFLLDSNNKKIAFLNQIIKKLNLKNANCVCERAEIFARKNEEKFDVVTSRAVASLRIILELGTKSLKINGVFIAMKAEAEKEILEAKSAEEKLSLDLALIKKFQLPHDQGKRTLIKYIKKNETNELYPRNYKKIVNTNI